MKLLILGLSILWVSFAWSSRSLADILVLAPAVDGTILDVTGDGVFDSTNATATSMTVRNFPGSVIDRAVMEFNISSIPTNATINSAVLTLTNIGIANAPLTIGFVGYSGDGNLTVSDGSIAGQTLLSVQYTTLSTLQIDLGTSFLQSRLGQTNFMGLRLQDAAASANIQFATSESSLTAQRPSLLVNFTAVPEPTCLGLLLGAAAFATCIQATRRLKAHRIRDNAITRAAVS